MMSLLMQACADFPRTDAPRSFGGSGSLPELVSSSIMEIIQLFSSPTII